MKIAIDGIAFSHPQPGGYHTYTRNLIEQLAQLDTRHSYLLLTDRQTSFAFPPNWQVEVVPAHIRGIGVAVREQFSLPARLRSARPSVLHSPCATGPLVKNCQHVITLLDTLEFTIPLPHLRHTRLWAMRSYSRLIQTWLARRASIIITISHYSKEQIAQRFSISPDKFIVTHLAAAPHFSQQDRMQAAAWAYARFGVQNYIIALASASPRKNIAHLLKEYSRLEAGLRDRFPLVLVFTHSSFKVRIAQQAADFGIQSNVIFLDALSDQDLSAVFSAARLFVFPSLEEGFGLPPLEAMACGTPVVASNTSSMPEVLGDAALLVSPTKADELAAAMCSVLTTPSLAEELCQRGLMHSKQFSWERTARETLAVYEQVGL